MSHKASSEQNVSDFAAIVYRRRWTALSVCAAFFGALAGYAYFSTPVYRAAALLDIEKVSDVVAEKQAYQPPDDDYLATQAKLVVSDTAVKKVYDELKLSETKDFAGGVNLLRAAVSVLGVPKTRLVTVNAESTDPKLAAAISNALAEIFVKENLDNQLFMPKDVLAALRTRARGPNAQKIYESLPAVINNKLIQDLKGEILKGEVALAELKGKYTDGHPAVAAMEKQLQLMRAARARELDIVVRSVTTQLSGQLRPNNVRVVDAAEVPRHPARPRRNLALLIGMVGGVCLGILAALGLDGLDQTLRTHSDVQGKLGLPFLGEIPVTKRKRGQPVYQPLVAPKETVSSEAFRDLRTMIAVARRKTDDPFLLVTSATQQEGKSFVATNLAVALSQLGRRVLIVDGDLRCPSQHHNLGSDAERGLADFLSGRVKDAAELVRKTDLPNLEVMSAGQPASNASELLDTDALAQLVAWARQRYDRVIVDCPPVFPVGDVLLWGRHARSSILVSRCGRTRVPLIQLACERLRVGGIDVLGGVLNGARTGRLSYVYGARAS